MALVVAQEIKEQFFNSWPIKYHPNKGVHLKRGNSSRCVGPSESRRLARLDSGVAPSGAKRQSGRVQAVKREQRRRAGVLPWPHASMLKAHVVTGRHAGRCSPPPMLPHLRYINSTGLKNEVWTDVAD
jgi:hypothetical protein